MTGIDQVLRHEQVHSVLQPIVDLDSGNVVAYEALARGPQGPLQRPDQLFAAARAAGRLAELDELCRRVALHQAIIAGVLAPLTLFVNVEPEVLDTAPLDELLAIADTAPGRLQVVLEITERALAARPAELLATVQRLRAAGWRIALDDVGADDLSLAFMPLLRPDIVKLDLRLVQRRPGPAVAEIMNAVNAYAERTGAALLAEGIEDETHLAVARALGARLGQGWLFGRPAATLSTRPTGALQLSPLPAGTVGVSPFACLPEGVTCRRSTKPLLIELSKHLEREAMRQGSTCIVLATFQEAQHFTPPTAHRYGELVDHIGFVAAFGGGLPPEPVAGVRGADLDPADPMRGEWDLAVLAPHFAAALLARDLGDTGPDMERRFEFALTYDRDTVAAAAEALMSRVLPHDEPVEAGQAAAPATGMLDRGRLEELLEVMLLQARMTDGGVALIRFGVDGADGVRTGGGRHGRSGNDALLQAVGTRLRRRLRRGDLVARLGDDDFLVVLPNLDQGTAAREGERVADELAGTLTAAQPVVAEAVAARVSIGVSTFPADGDSCDELLQAAAGRMYAARI